MMCILRILLLACALSLTEAIRNPWGKGEGRRGEDKCRLDGSDESAYRGKVSVTVSGRFCVRWNSIPNEQCTTFKNCNHNYCRNPDNNTKPWCMVRKRNRYVRENCDIPHKEIKPTMSLSTPGLSKQDTESTCGERGTSLVRKIIGGSRSTVESQPWIAAIYRGNGFICGGTLIAPCWVLTAAHCFPTGKNTQATRYSVVLGKNAINETESVKEQRFTVSKVVVHEDFDYTTERFNHDIALLKIVDRNGRCAGRTDFVRTACLPPYQQMLPAGFNCEIAGYGRYQKGGFENSRHLKQAHVQLISQDACQRMYSKDEVTKNMLCAVGRHWAEDACKGDSGGPLMCEVNKTMFLFGIISWGKECAEKFNPGVYTKITNYNHWISKHTRLPRYTAGSKYPQKD